MTALQIPCANPDCRNMRRETSKYCSRHCASRCQRSAARAGVSLKSAKQCANPGCQNITMFRFCSTKCSGEYFHTENHGAPTHKAGDKPVLVTDPQCTPYFMPRNECDGWLAQNAFAPGTVLDIDGEKITIQAQQEEMTL